MLLSVNSKEVIVHFSPDADNHCSPSMAQCLCTYSVCKTVPKLTIPQGKPAPSL